MAEEEIKEPEDLGIKIGTKEEVLWTKVKKAAEVLIEQSEEHMIVQKAMLKLAEENIKKEQEKMKNGK